MPRSRTRRPDVQAASNEKAVAAVADGVVPGDQRVRYLREGRAGLAEEIRAVLEDHEIDFEELGALEEAGEFEFDDRSRALREISELVEQE